MAFDEVAHNRQAKTQTSLRAINRLRLLDE
jgi:hypothetical protein